MIDAAQLLQQYYLPTTVAQRILLRHSELVAARARAIALRLRAAQREVDVEFVTEAALLHDIGIFATHSPTLGCYGQLPYLRHGVVGRDILAAMGLPRHAAVCANHIGVGLSASEIQAQNLPLPAEDFIPATLEEEIIAYADLFFSKNPARLEQERDAAAVRATLAGYGAEKTIIFDAWQQRFDA